MSDVVYITLVIACLCILTGCAAGVVWDIFGCSSTEGRATGLQVQRGSQTLNRTPVWTLGVKHWKRHRETENANSRNQARPASILDFQIRRQLI